MTAAATVDAIDLPPPRKPRTKVPSLEVIVRTQDGNDLGLMGPLNRDTVELSIRILRASCRELGDSLDTLLPEIRTWANRTFPNGTPASKAAHLVREAEELRQSPTDLEEMADIFILLAHLSVGQDLAGAVRAKLDKNKARKWGQPDGEGVVEHVRDQPSPTPTAETNR